MIPRLDGGYYPEHWPEMPQPEPARLGGSSLFTPLRPTLRKIVVMVDAELLSDPSARRPLTFALVELLHRPYVRVYVYPTDFTWTDGGSGRSFRYSDGRSARGDWVDMVDEDVGASVVAGKVGVDFYITDRARLLAEKRWLQHVGHYPSGEPPCLSPAEGVALLGLYLRMQGDYSIVGKAKQRVGVDGRMYFYWAGARVILPDMWRLHQWAFDTGAHCADAVFSLAASVAHRVESALQERDAVHALLNQVDEIYAGREAFVRLDSCLLMLMGAFDAQARVAHLVLHSARWPEVMESRQAAWQNSAWLQKLRTRYPEFVGLVQQGSQRFRILEALRMLRNTIHGTSLATSSRALLHFGISHQLSLGSFGALKESLRSVCDADQWLIEQDDSTAAIDVGALLEVLFPLAISLLNALISCTRLEDIPEFGERKAKHTFSPPPNEGLGLLSIEICYQLGIDPYAMKRM